MIDRLEKLTRLFEADPSDPFLAYGIALEHAKAERFEAAIQWLDKTLEIDGCYCYAYFQKAKMLSETGDEIGARQILKSGMATAEQAGDEHAHSEMAELLATLNS